MSILQDGPRHVRARSTYAPYHPRHANFSNVDFLHDFEQSDAAIRRTRTRGFGVAGIVGFAALYFGLVRQGAFYASQAQIFLVLSIAAGLCSVRGVAQLAHAVQRRVGVVALAFVSLVLFGVPSSLANDGIAQIAPLFWLSLGLVSLIAVGAVASTRNALLVVRLIQISGALIAASGILGVIFRLLRWAVALDSWRASSTLTYANTMAAWLVMVALFSLARVVNRNDIDSLATRRFDSGVSTLCLVGLVASGSRAGVLALGVGMMLLAIHYGLATIVRSVSWVAGGVVVGSFGVLLSANRGGMTPHESLFVHPAVAVTTFVLLALGLFVGMKLPQHQISKTVIVPRELGVLQEAWRRWILAITLIFGLGLAFAFRNSLRGGLASRITLGSQDRSDLWGAAFRLVRAKPLTGNGFGRLPLYFERDGAFLFGNFVHNEWLEYLAQVGVVGFIGLIALMISVVVCLRRARPERTHPNNALWVGVVCALSAFAVHATFDFLWHSIALLGLAAILLGSALASSTIDSRERVIERSQTKENI